ncbi:translation initiation factor 2 [Methylobacterium sp. sgz302541]|uniref:COG4223 family protein n=1 Tax=unclassified Methylobacterium TaxID=2615210 RepID=UPI003D34C630
MKTAAPAAGAGKTSPGTPPAAGKAPGPETAKPTAATGPAVSGAAKPATADATSGAPGAGTSKAEPRLSNGPKTGFVGAGATGGRPGEAVTDGPIIDLKAKRIPDPVTAAPKSAPPKSPEPKSAEPKSAEPKSAEPKAATAATMPAAEPAAGGSRGFGSLAAAGLIGGVLGAGLLFAVEQARGPGDAARFAALDQKIAALAPKDALAALDKRIAASETALKPLPEAVRNADATARQALAKAGGSAQPGAAAPDGASAEQGKAAPPPADVAARLDSLEQRVAALQEEPGKEQPADSALSATQAGEDGKALATLDARVKALESGPGNGKPATESDLPSKLAALQSDAEARAKADREADAALGQRLDQLQQSLDARVKAATEAVATATAAARQTAEAGRSEAQEAAKGVERQLQEQRDRIADLDKAVARRADASTVQAALRVVAADRIASALRSGAPYADTLAALRGFGGDTSGLDPLSPFAGTGAPTPAQLATEFRAIAERIAAKRKAAQARSVAETGDIKQRLFSMAESIVQVRKVDTPAASEAQAGGDPTAKVQAALDKGALGEAAAAFDALPQEARAEAGDFGARLKARAAAGAAAQTLAADAFKGLNAPPASEPAR